MTCFRNKILLAISSAALLGCSTLETTGAAAVVPDVEGATEATRAANAAFSETLPWSNTADEELASRGFIATRGEPLIKTPDGRIAMDLSAYDFAEGDAPETVNPSLWRHLKLIKKHGLFEVGPGIWQVRGFDLAVMSVLATDTGYVIVDPLTSSETAEAAFDLVKQHIGDKPVHAVIYTHSHGDHNLGVSGVVDAEDVASGKVQILAPEGFMEHTIGEVLVAGPAMSRRLIYQMGLGLPTGPEGNAGAGIGPAIARGTTGLIPPTRTIRSTGERVVIDGLEIIFQVTPGTEAPAEMNFYLPQSKALCLAENANVTMHNVLTPRGALVRDAKAWAHYLTESDRLFGHKSQIMFNSHGWPRWGSDEISRYIKSHRDAYKYLHDQSVRLMNKGLTGREIAEEIALPDSISSDWFNRGYYGSMSHNSKAVYQRYMGWYDAHPANLNPWPPEEAGQRYVEAMGGAEKAVKVASDAFEAGDYRWAAEVARHVVFADADNMDARELMAQAFEQMAWQTENMLWRNIYLVGAAEARRPPDTPAFASITADRIAGISTPEMLELMAIRVDPEAAKGKDIAVRFVFEDSNKRLRLTLKNAVMVQQADIGQPADATLTLSRSAMVAMLFGGVAPQRLIETGRLKIAGDPTALRDMMASLDRPAAVTPFGIVTP